jgi:hypothetical protein
MCGLANNPMTTVDGVVTLEDFDGVDWQATSATQAMESSKLNTL